MKAFIDTSSLIKKYINENGSDQFEDILAKITEIIIAPTYLLEIHSAANRRLLEKTINKKEFDFLLKEVKKDFYYFFTLQWNENLEKKALDIIQKFHLRTLDSIQLACACLSKADIFITSDKKLFSTAKKEIKKTRLIS